MLKRGWQVIGHARGVKQRSFVLTTMRLKKPVNAMQALKEAKKKYWLYTVTNVR